MNLKGNRRFRVYEQVLNCYTASINKEISIFQSYQSYQYKKNGLIGKEPMNTTPTAHHHITKSVKKPSGGCRLVGSKYMHFSCPVCIKREVFSLTVKEHK